MLSQVGPEFAYLSSYGTYFGSYETYFGSDKIFRGRVPLPVTDSSCYRFSRALFKARIHKSVGDGEGVDHGFRKDLRINMLFSAFCFKRARIVSMKGQNGKSALQSPPSGRFFSGGPPCCMLARFCAYRHITRQNITLPASVRRLRQNLEFSLH